MSILKLIFNDSQPSMLAKVASQMTLLETSRHIKSASEDSEIRRKLAELKPESKDHFLVHFIALGEGETYGPNRNHDYFTKEACEKYHDTFVEHGHFFREHDNKDPKKKIGMIKASYYNKPMGRVELVIEGDRKLCPDVYELVKKGNTISGSMSCLVPEDYSSITGKAHKTLADYDEYCKYRMGQYIPEFKKYAYVVNKEPKWFDYSYVAKPADRIAHYLEYKLEQDEVLQKAASTNRTLTGADLAKIFSCRSLDITQPLGCANSENQKILEKLASTESYIHEVLNDRCDVQDNKYHFTKTASTKAWSDAQLTNEQIQEFRKLNPNTLLQKLASKSIFLPFESFCAIINNQTIEEATNDSIIKYAFCNELPDLFSKLINSPTNELEDLFSGPDGMLACSDPKTYNDPVDKMTEMVKDKFGIAVKPTSQRIMSMTITITSAGPKMKEKKASVDNVSEQDKLIAKNLASLYGFYKIATIRMLKNIHGDNFIDTPENILIITQNIK